jgi:hypothetical protein
MPSGLRLIERSTAERLARSHSRLCLADWHHRCTQRAGMRRTLLFAAALLATSACQATGMGWIPSASETDPTAKATFGFVYDGASQTFSGSYHDKAMGVDLKGSGVLKESPPPAGVKSKGGCLAGELVPYESQNPDYPGDGTLTLFVCDIDGSGSFSKTDFLAILVTSGPFTDYVNFGDPSGNITVTSP